MSSKLIEKEAALKYAEEKILAQNVDSVPMKAFGFDLFAVITTKAKGDIHVTYVNHDKM